MSRIAVAGATGYIGGRLVPRLIEAGHEVRVLTRRAARLRDIPWAGSVEVVEGSCEEREAAERLCAGVDTLYYLVHSMGGHPDFEDAEERCARVMAEAARTRGVGRIVYLSGLHPDGELSRHLRSRVRVGELLSASGVPTVVLQAGLVIGSGSASFEMVRHLTEVLPVMPAPRWVLNRVQPIAVRDALHYLCACASLPAGTSGAFDVGGPEAHSYADMMRLYAEAAGLRRPAILPLPVLTPWLAAQWVNLVTPIPRSLAVPLVGSLQHDCVVRERRIDHLVPRPAGGLTPYRRAVELALEKIGTDAVETSWATAHAVAQPADPLPSDPDWAGRPVYVDVRELDVDAPPEAVFGVVQGIGGGNGWYSLPGAWGVRGLIDKLAGGVGLRRGRRSSTRLLLGDVVDFWRVEEVEQDRLLRLRAEMRVPGNAWLEFTIEPRGSGSLYRQRAVFFPRGLAGRLYWWSVAPFHGHIFGSMMRRITAAALQAAGTETAPGPEPAGR
ncbi:SDR family oxidoreductase [Zafaria sp. J156]|uniref:SDR family oxidoreductase n=1 Tax=Zafaria sp. J156 TaxID=3116490 RepID=UPI002E76B0F2|nr:SDR family oxidoreductase [Zafaria sp. J156]MEE1620948.1 SDR family oxidoreductase [Zafaria sp. J156]